MKRDPRNELNFKLNTKLKLSYLNLNGNMWVMATIFGNKKINNSRPPKVIDHNTNDIYNNAH